MIPRVIIIGADKGGVGKTMLSRLVLDYLTVKGVAYRAFDSETPSGVLKRFYPDQVRMVDLTESDGQMAIFDHLGPEATVIDIRAGILLTTLRMLADIGYLDPAKCRITVLHVLGSSHASIAEVSAVTDAVATARYIAVANRVNDTKFTFPVGSLDIPKLDERACESVDGAGVSFSAYLASPPSGVLGGHVRHWRGKVFSQFEVAGLAAA